MLQFIETIRVYGGKAENIPYHMTRVETTCRRCLNIEPPFSLPEVVASLDLPHELSKLRICYGMKLESVEVSPYAPRPVRSLQMVEADIDYRFKYADRSGLNEAFARRCHADDVLIVKDGFITDTSIANVALWDGHCWQTPAHPLLEGTRRRQLLDCKKISATDIVGADIYKYKAICLFNAMIPFGEIAFEISPVAVLPPQ